jgi:hypothetical protein
MEKYAVVAFQMSSFLWLLTFCCGVDYKHLGLIVLYYCFGNGGMFAAGALEVMAGELFRHPCRGLVVYVLKSSTYALTKINGT